MNTQRDRQSDDKKSAQFAFNMRQQKRHLQSHKNMCLLQETHSAS